ncbi:MAG TPA: hypothetical protein VHJ38_06390 [Nitrososphaeraceae archaeon]|nr:hypothetical protein [Nitrososphaeraceae archaeon]
MIRKSNNIKQALYVIAAIAVLLFNSYNSQQIFGHNFAGDESASFLALMDQMKIEMNLINTNLIANNNNNNNQSLIAKDHLNKINDELYTEKIKKEIAERNERIANEISSIINEASIAIGKEQEKDNQDTSVLVKNFNDIIEEAVSVRIDPDAMTNATVHALRFADLINSIDISYATALGIKPMNMSAMNMATAGDNMSHSNNSKSDNNTTTMSSINMDHRSSSSNSNSNSMVNMSKNTVNNSNAAESPTIISNITSYQTAKELTNVAIDLFNSTIKQNIPSNATENANAIESGLQELKGMIESKNPYDKVMGVIHGIIQTNTQEAFNLPLKTSQ